MSPEHLRELAVAKRHLDSLSLAVKLSNKLGKGIEGGLQRLPEGATDKIMKVTQKSLEGCLKLATTTMASSEPEPPSNWGHKLAVMGTGAVGGAFGFPGLAVELPVTTSIMLRSIADIARSEGEDLDSPEAQLACIEVFALGGSSPDDDQAKHAYIAMRIGLASTLAKAAEGLARIRHQASVNEPPFVG